MADENEVSVAKKRRLEDFEDSTSTEHGGVTNGVSVEGVGQEELDQLRQFDVLDEVKGDDSSDEGPRGKARGM